MPKDVNEYKLVLAAPESEFDVPFVQGMANRMSVSYHKYGAVAEGYPGKFDALASAIARIERYMDSGNTEFLMDAANFLMIEFMHPRHPNAHFEGTDSDGSIGRVTNDGRTTKRSNQEVVTTKTGKILLDEDFDALADEAERDHNLSDQESGPSGRFLFLD